MGNKTSKSNSGIDEMDSNCDDKKIASMSESDSEEDITMERDESQRYHNNGAKYVEKVKISELGSMLSPKPKNVIGLDFGTSTLAVCYVTSGSDKLYQFKIQDEDVDFYTPTVLLIEHNKVEIGSRALRRYIRLEVDVNNSIFFDKIKLELQHNKSVNHETTIKSSEGVEYYLIEVIAIILRKVKEKLEHFFKNREGGYNIEDFHWVLTVPALWGIRARDMMREAAYLAGLCSDVPDGSHYLPLVPLQPASNHDISQIKPTALEFNPHKLSLVFEPEAAAVACMKLETDPSINPPGPNDCYLTVDIGGGTIDITAHQVCEDGALQILNIPHGRVYGGTEVNEKFKKFIATEVFRDPTFSRYLKTNRGREHKVHCAQLHGFINKEFEEAKKNFGSDNEADIQYDGTCYNFNVPPTLIEVYRNELQGIRGGSTGVSYKRATQLMSINKVMLKKLFEDNIKAIRECIDDVLEKVGKDNVKLIYLVGGFGGCRYITSCIQQSYRNLPVVRPFEPEYAVAKGACLFYKEKVLRTADATYGIGTSMKYDHSNPTHKPAFKIVDDCEYCDNLFQPYIHKGDEIKPDIVYSDTFLPFYAYQTTVSFTLYSTPDYYIDHVKKEDGSLPDGLEEIGYLNVDISSGMHLPYEKREVQFVLDFSSTEIHVYGWFIQDKTPVKATCDFLSTIKNVKKFTT